MNDVGYFIVKGLCVGGFYCVVVDFDVFVD